MIVFIVYWHDRHTDPSLSVHATREGANAKLESHKSEYIEDGYTWTEQSYGRDIGWVRFVESGGGDGPNGRIIECEVQS